MYGAIKRATVCMLVSLVGSTVMAAEMRDVGQMTSAVNALRSSTAAIAPSTPEALGFQVSRALGLDNKSNLELKQERQLPNNLGRTLRFTQTYNGIPIWGTSVVVNQDANGRTIDIAGKAAFNIDVPADAPVSPQLSPEDALRRAKEATTRTQSLAEQAQYENEAATLVYFLNPEGRPRLSYHTTFFTTKQTAGGGIEPTRPVFIIDAMTGETLYFYENIQFVETGTGPGGNQKTGRYVYGSGTLPKFDVTESGTTCQMDGTILKTENLNHGTSGSGAPWQFTCHENTVKEINGAYSPLNDAEAFGKVVFDMYKDWYGASPLTQKLHMRVHYSANYENAFWDGQRMTFGDGHLRFYPLVSLDVAAHEVSHGFTEQNSGLIYQNQSGGMNEAFSDMAGEAAEYYFVSKYGRPFSRTMPDLETGADIFKVAGQALRYMCDPPRDGRSIGHVRDYRDGMDVHYSSGVYNKAFCLLSQRSGWNIKKTFDVFVVANQSYWTPNETFQGGAEKALQAAKRLGAGYPEADVIYAFSQVGINIGPPPTGGQYLYTTLRVITNGSSRGCSYANWTCMTNLCTSDLGSPAWRGWAGCWRDGDNYQCYFECGQIRKLF
jgi:vibriolysin